MCPFIYCIVLPLLLLLFSCEIVSSSLQFHGLHHDRLLCPSLLHCLLKLMSIELVRPSNRLILCHPILLLPSIFPESGSFAVSQLFAAGGQSIGASASALALSMNIQGWLSLGFTGLIFLLSKGLSKVSSNTTVESINSSALSLLYGPILTSIHDYWKNHGFDYMDLCGQSDVSA